MSKVILKRSSVSGKIPTTADLEYGELALNYADGIAYFKKSDNTISTIGTGSISASTLLDSIKTVDGSSSGLDSDLLDGFDGSYYLDWTNTTNKPDPTITLAGALTGSVTLTDLASGTLTAGIAANSIALGTDTTGNYVAAVAVSGTGLSVTGSGESATYTVTSNATASNISSTIVARDASGNFTAGTITAELNGNAATVTNGIYSTGSYVDPSWLSITKSKVGLGNVENTALSTWTGSSNITTLGNITTGSWSGSTISVAKGGTGSTSLTVNNVLLGNGTNAVQAVAPGTAGNILTSNGTTWISSAPAVALFGKTDSTTPYQTSLGYQAGNVNTGANNTFIGYQAGLANTSGTQNTTIGYEALYSNTDGYYNTVIGYRTLRANISGTYNTAIGTEALRVNTTGSYNIAVGSAALYYNTTGTNNCAFGLSALQSNTIGEYNTAVGDNAGWKITTGIQNTILGAFAGAYSTNLTTGSNNIIIGYTAQPSSATVSNEITLGNSAVTAFRIPGLNINWTTTTVPNVNTNSSYADPTWITSLAKSKVGLSNVENTALSTWTGSSNITTIGAATATSLTVTGDLTVNGTTTTINSTTISVDDKNIELGSVTTPTNTTADGGGITLKGATDKTFNWSNTTAAWTSSEHIALAAGKDIILNGATSGSVTLIVPDAAGTTTITLPATTGTVITTGDSGTVTNTMLAGSIANAKLANSSITVNGTAISLGGSGTITATATNALTIGSYLTGTSYNGSSAVTIAVDATSANTASKVVARDANGDFTARIITATDFNATSDPKLKQKIGPAPGLELVNQINSWEFIWKESGDRSYGVMADEFEELCPELVDTVDGIKTVKYIPIIAMLVKSVQQLSSRLEELERNV